MLVHSTYTKGNKMKEIKGMWICTGITIYGMGPTKEAAYKNFKLKVENNHEFDLIGPEECSYYFATKY